MDKITNRVFIDFETRSAIDIKKAGAFVYASHPSTEALCLAYSINGAEPKLWKRGEAYPQDLFEHVREGSVFVAHNASFDWLIWNYSFAVYECPALLASQMECTKARALIAGFPTTLGDLSKFLNLPQKKNEIGHLQMLKVSKPKSLEPLVWCEDPVLMNSLYEYCKQDVRTLIELDKKLPPLKERELFSMDLEMNEAGLAFDEELVVAGLALIEKVKKECNKEIELVTAGGVLKGTEGEKIKKWARTEYNVDIKTLNKNEFVLDEEWPEPVKKVLETRSLISRSSTAKLQKFLDMKDKKGRVHDFIQYYGALTGRYAGRGIQIQNFPRVPYEEKETVLIQNKVKRGEDVELKTLSQILRSVVIPRNNFFYDVDFSSIEARIVAWMAGEETALSSYRKGEDLYVKTAARVYGIKEGQVTEAQRQVGKACVLALGYQGGVKAFQRTSKMFKLSIKDEEAEIIKTAWRAYNPNIVSYWYVLESAARTCIINKQAVKIQAGGAPIKFKFDNNLPAGPFMLIELPSGRDLYYYRPQIQSGKVIYYAKQGGVKTYGWEPLYGGLILENITQGIARDVLVEAMVRLEKTLGLKTVFTVHDEIVLDLGSEHLNLLTEIDKCCILNPRWAEGLPISVESWRGAFYK